jgi:NADH dehydrogenase [ubiquinone] 1 alpha subcomplex assembly factor 7
MITRGGPIAVSAYMALCLSHPEHGYYVRRDPFGSGGDFTTAPEVSQLFGETLGVWLVLAWRQLGAPDPVLLVELGPGRGTLMADLHRTLVKVEPALAAAARIHLVENSPLLAGRQAATLAVSAEWHRDIASVPRAPLLLLANEFFDALPVMQLVMTGGVWRERCVDWDPAQQRFLFCVGRPIAPPLANLSARDGAVVEINPSATAIAQEIGVRLAEQSGAALVIDYAARAAGDSLVGISGHRTDVDPLAAPGEADLSARVDFTALAGALTASGARCFGPRSQRDLLLALGIESRTAALVQSATAEQAQTLLRARDRLLDPAGMGNFSALAATSAAAAPAGFA